MKATGRTYWERNANKIYRGWVNQPSGFDPLHDLHGRKCIVHEEHPDYVCIYFTEGNIISRIAPRNAIAREWICKQEQDYYQYGLVQDLVNHND